MCGSDKLSNFI